MKSQTISESKTLLACCKIVNIMFDENYDKAVLKFCMSHNAISCHIFDMSQKIKSQAIESTKATCFAIQLDEFIDITRKVQLLTSLQVYKYYITKQSIFCKQPPEIV